MRAEFVRCFDPLDDRGGGRFRRLWPRCESLLLRKDISVREQDRTERVAAVQRAVHDPKEVPQRLAVGEAGQTEFEGGGRVEGFAHAGVFTAVEPVFEAGVAEAVEVGIILEGKPQCFPARGGVIPEVEAEMASDFRGLRHHVHGEVGVLQAPHRSGVVTVAVIHLAFLRGRGVGIDPLFAAVGLVAGHEDEAFDQVGVITFVLRAGDGELHEITVTEVGTHGGEPQRVRGEMIVEILLAEVVVVFPQILALAHLRNHDPQPFLEGGFFIRGEPGVVPKEIRGVNEAKRSAYQMNAHPGIFLAVRQESETASGHRLRLRPCGEVVDSLLRVFRFAGDPPREGQIAGAGGLPVGNFREGLGVIAHVGLGGHVGGQLLFERLPRQHMWELRRGDPLLHRGQLLRVHEEPRVRRQDFGHHESRFGGFRFRGHRQRGGDELETENDEEPRNPCAAGVVGEQLGRCSRSFRRRSRVCETAPRKTRRCI